MDLSKRNVYFEIYKEVSSQQGIKLTFNAHILIVQFFNIISNLIDYTKKHVS